MTKILKFYWFEVIELKHLSRLKLCFLSCFACVCLSVHLHICPPSLSVCLTVSLSICISVHLSAFFLFMPVWVCLFLFSSFGASCQFGFLVWLSLCNCVYLSYILLSPSLINANFCGCVLFVPCYQSFICLLIHQVCQPPVDSLMTCPGQIGQKLLLMIFIMYKTMSPFLTLEAFTLVCLK